MPDPGGKAHRGGGRARAARTWRARQGPNDHRRIGREVGRRRNPRTRRKRVHGGAWSGRDSGRASDRREREGGKKLGTDRSQGGWRPGGGGPRSGGRARIQCVPALWLRPPVAEAGSAGGEEVEGGDHRCAQGKRCDGGAERGRGAPPRHEGTGGTEKARQRGREGNGRAPPGTRAYGSALRASGEIRGGAAGKVGGERASEDGASPWGSGTFPPPGGGAGGVVARTCDGWERGGGKTRKGRPAGVDGARGRPKTAAHRRARTPSGGPVAKAAASCNRARAARGCTAARGWAALAGAPASGEGARDAKCAAEVVAEVGRAPAAAGPGQVAAPAAAVCRRGGPARPFATAGSAGGEAAEGGVRCGAADGCGRAARSAATSGTERAVADGQGLGLCLPLPRGPPSRGAR